MKTTTNKDSDKNFALEIKKQEDELRLGDADLLVEATSLPHLVDDRSSSEKMSEKRGLNSGGPKPFQFVPLQMGGNGRTHMVSEGSRLMMEEVTLDDLKFMTCLFYSKAFEDKTLDKFIRSHEDPHAERFALWIHQKLSGSTVWDDERRARDMTPVKIARGIEHVVHDRTSAHAGAWYSPKRPENEIGRHFNLEECRVWMRLHFWALRESGITEKSPSFADYYMRYIGHFVAVYERSAPKFARESFRWSANPDNIHEYEKQNMRVMKDVLGLSRVEAESQLPQHELEDYEWPYNQTAE